jgi:hypothetical protein
MKKNQNKSYATIKTRNTNVRSNVPLHIDIAHAAATLSRMAEYWSNLLLSHSCFPFCLLPAKHTRVSRSTIYLSRSGGWVGEGEELRRGGSQREE